MKKIITAALLASVSLTANCQPSNPHEKLSLNKSYQTYIIPIKDTVKCYALVVGITDAVKSEGSITPIWLICWAHREKDQVKQFSYTKNGPIIPFPVISFYIIPAK